MPENSRPPEIEIVADRDAMARAAARRFVALARQSIVARGRFCIALSGGSTPRDLYARLAAPEFSSQVDWAHIQFFWGDERAVPPDDPESNYRMAYETLLTHVKPPPQNIHRILAEMKPAEAARAYEKTLRDVFLQPGLAGTLKLDSVEYPRFDLTLLGLGVNGHTASLFPKTAVLHEVKHWVVAEYIDEVKMNRITLTTPVINAAENILFIVAGSDKAATVRAVLNGEYRPEELPAQLIRPTDGHLVWLLDRDAAAQLDP